MKKTKFFTCIAMLGLILSLGACTTNDDTGSSNPSSSDTGTSSDTGGSTDTSGTEEHTHSYEVTEHKDATCTEAGYDVYTCSCGDTYTDPIPALGHDYQPVVTDPTCTEKGYTTYTCSRCGDTYTADETEATGHTPAGEYLSDEEGHWQVCSVCGEAVGKTAHTPSGEYQSDGNSHWQVCSVCGYKLNETAHTAAEGYQSDGNSHWQVCATCGHKLNETAHTPAEGYQHDDTNHWQVCSVCNAELNKAAHTASTEYEKGEGYHWNTCTVCGVEMNKATHTPAGEYLSDETGHWQVCSDCGEVVGFEAHTAAEGYQSDGTYHWQVCATCGYVLNKTAHTEGSLGVIDEQYHGTTCTVCQAVLSQEAHTYTAVYENEQWDEVCTACGYSSQINLDSKYALYGDFEDADWVASPTSSTYTLEYSSKYPETKTWTRTVKMAAYDNQDYRAAFRVIEYGNYSTDVVTASHLDASSTGVYESTWNIAVHWGGTYDITIDYTGETPSIYLYYHGDGYEEPAYTAYAITGEFADASWSVEPAENSTYYISLDETIAERTVTLATGLSYDPSFYVVGYGTWNHVLDYSNLTEDSESTLTPSNDNGIAGEAGQTYDLVLDFVNSTIKVTIHEEEVDTSITNETNLQAALNEGGNITLESDIVVTTPLVASKDATLDMSGYTIYNETDIYNDDTFSWSLLSIQNGAKVTITGNGTFAGLANDPYAVDVRNGSTLIIENGTFIGNVTCIYIEEGFVYIYGGHFSIIQTSSINGPYKYVLNCYDANNKAGTACFYLYGGEYENFDPSVATGTKDDEGNTLYEAVVMDGYTVVSSEIEGGGTLYSVVETPVEEHTFVADLSSLPNATFGEENTNGTNNPKSGVWTRGIFYYWADNSWASPWYAWVTVNNASYSEELGGYNFAWTTSTDYGSAEPYAFQIFYTLPAEAGLEVGATYSLKISFITDYEGYIEINGTAVYANIGENTVTIDGLTATELTDLSIQAGDNLYVDGGNFPLTGSFTITYLAFDF